MTGYTPPAAEPIAAPGPAPAAAPELSADSYGFFAQALAAFRQGEYGNATRLAGHAAIDDPRSQQVHMLTMLGLFAMGEYRGAAMEAHAVAALGRVPDWPTLYGYYGDVAPYTEQLRKLEKYVDEHPRAAEGRFLLGFQYLMAEHKDAAKEQLLQAVKMTPRDVLAAKLLTQVGGTVPADIAKQQAEMAPPEGAKAPRRRHRPRRNRRRRRSSRDGGGDVSILVGQVFVTVHRPGTGSFFGPFR